MSNLLIILIIYLAFMVLALFFSRGDILSPSVLFFGSFCIMLVFANIFQWYFNYKIKNETFWIFLSAGAVFLITEYGYKYVKHSIHNVKIYAGGYLRDDGNIKHPIVISPKVQILSVVFMLIVVAITCYCVIVGTDVGTWSQRVGQYETARHDIGFSSPTPVLDFIVGQTTRLGNALSFVFLYIVIYNRVGFGIKLWKQKMLIVVAILSGLVTMLGGGRRHTIEMVIYCVLIYVILQKDIRKRLKIIKFIFAGVSLFIIFIFTFTAVSNFVGGADEKINPMIYVSTYMCSALKNFDELIVGRPCISKYFGQSSFYEVYSFLIKFFHILPSKEAISYHSFGFFRSNTVTIFGRWYEDFGTTGVLFMSMVVSLYFSILRESSKIKKAPNLTHIIFAQQVMALVWASYDDRFAPLISANNIITIIIIAFLYRIFVGGGKYLITFRGKKISLRSGVNKT